MNVSKELDVFWYELRLNAWHDLYVQKNYAFDSQNAIIKMDKEFDEFLERKGWKNEKR